jgi:hypothetical protein
MFVLQSTLPRTCPIHFPLPQFTYPILRPMENKIKRPLLLSNALFQQLMSQPLAQFSPDSSLMALHCFVDSAREHTALWNTNYQLFEAQEEYAHISSSSSCLVDRSCADASKMLLMKLATFAQVREHFLEQGLISAATSVQWLCADVIHRLNDSPLCADIAVLYFKQFLYSLQAQDAAEEAEWQLLQEGFKYNPHNPNIKAVYRYRNWNNFIVETNAAQAYSFTFTFIGGLEKFGGLGGGICDNMLHRVDNDRIFHPLSSVLSDRLFGFEKPFVSHYVTEEQYDANRHADAIPRSRPYYTYSETVLHALIPPGLRDTAIVDEAKRSIEEVCARRAKLRTVLVFGPAMSGTEHIQELLVQEYQDNNRMYPYHNVSFTNSEIIQAVGCSGDLTDQTSCQHSLHNLASGYLETVAGDGEFWRDVSQRIYQQRLHTPEDEEVALIADPLFSFTSPLWQGPLGTVEVVLVLMSPAEAVYCLSRGIHVPLDTALSMWLTYFKALLSASLSFERIHLLEYRPGSSTQELDMSLRRITPFASLFGEGKEGSGLNAQKSGRDDERRRSYCDLSDFSPPSAVAVPGWAQTCFDFLLRERFISPELCLAHL